jgi:hypothetical protein
VANGFDVVSVWIQYEGAVIIRVVVRARAWSTVVFASGGNGCAIKLVDLLAIGGSKCNVHRRRLRRAFVKPKVGFGGNAEAQNNDTFRVLSGYFHEYAVSQGRKRSFVEEPALVGITDIDSGVVNHGVRPFGMGR